MKILTTIFLISFIFIGCKRHKHKEPKEPVVIEITTDSLKRLIVEIENEGYVVNISDKVLDRQRQLQGYALGSGLIIYPSKPVSERIKEYEKSLSTITIHTNMTNQEACDVLIYYINKINSYKRLIKTLEPNPDIIQLKHKTKCTKSLRNSHLTQHTS